ncbi:hypothetical protein J2R80_000636 [Bradyrhizobium sp. USDA 4541]|nr:hypothetical protein [Bradyrhizobium sp. USDA 4541]
MPQLKTLNFDIDYKRLLSEFQSRGTLLRAFYCTAIIEDQEYSSIRPLIDWLDYNGYTVVTKATKEFIDASGRRKVKGNNAGTIISFRVGSEDATYLARECQERFDEIDLLQLPNYRIYLKLMIDGTPSLPFSVTTLSPG